MEARQKTSSISGSEAAQERVAELIDRERDARLTDVEAAELNHFLELEHILRMAKAKARLVLAKTC